MVTIRDHKGEDAMQEGTVAVKMTDFITLMSSEVARKVVDELRESDINPLYTKINAIEVKLATPNHELERQGKKMAHWQGFYDGLWKAAVIILGLAQMYQMFK